MAHKNSMSAQETAERIASFLISIGCDRVYDINVARHLALLESYREFKNKREQGDSQLPIISSVCPGWICYAEKTNGDLIIPNISRVRSPQQIMGALLKRVKKRDIYHVTLMPCFDKKLEASRSDFKDEITGEQDVDCVLTPVELEEILNDEGAKLEDFALRKLDIIEEFGVEFANPLTSHSGSLSGGYAENILLSTAVEIYGNDCDRLKSCIEYTTMKNSDFTELTLKGPEGSNSSLSTADNHQIDGKLPRCAIVNGFRNIQTIVQRLKRKALKYDYIEIMACPSGCINGGAQCRPKDGENQDATIKGASRLYGEVPTVETSKLRDGSSNERFHDLIGLRESSDLNQLLYTEFHPVPKMQNLTVSW